MSLTLNTEPVTGEIKTAHALKTANLQKSQQAIEGEMAIKLIASANIETLAMPIGNVGQNINIKA
jgi:hypothetical protein